jgi:hypothetical protein
MRSVIGFKFESHQGTSSFFTMATMFRAPRQPSKGVF